jgi:hypothetical protein
MTVPRTVRLPDDLDEKLRKRAAEDHRTITATIELALREYLRRGKRK